MIKCAIHVTTCDFETCHLEFCSEFCHLECFFTFLPLIRMIRNKPETHAVIIIKRTACAQIGWNMRLFYKPEIANMSFV